MIRKSGLLTGLASGILLGLFLKLIEQLTGKKVYILLLNVDFIPLIGHIHWPEIIEFFFHLLIAALLGVLYSTIVSVRQLKSGFAQLILSILLTIPTIFLYFPLTLLAYKETPAVHDFAAFFYWTIGHLLFSLFLFAFYRLWQK